MPGWIRDTADGATLTVRVAPRASRTEIKGIWGDGPEAVVKVALAAPPVDGRANEELIAHLAGIFDVQRSQVEVIAGRKSKNKVVRVRGRSAAEVAALLGKFPPDNRSGVP